MNHFCDFMPIKTNSYMLFIISYFYRSKISANTLQPFNSSNNIFISALTTTINSITIMNHFWYIQTNRYIYFIFFKQSSNLFRD